MDRDTEEMPADHETPGRAEYALDAFHVVREAMLTRIKEKEVPLSIRKKCLVVVDQLDAIAVYDQKASLESVRAELDQQGKAGG